MTTTPANDSAAAVIAALDPDRTRTHKQVVIEARTAFAAILDRLERVEKALKPFAEAGENMVDLEDDDSVVDDQMITRYKVGDITAGDLIRATIVYKRATLLAADEEVKP